MGGDIVVLGIFVADMSFRGARPPKMGETLLGDSFTLGPGGKGSNQAIAAARAGGRVRFVTRLGDDAFADMAEALWREAGVTPAAVRDAASYTGAASIFVDRESGDNAITVAPGAAMTLSAADMEAEAARIAGAAVFLTQLEQPLEAALRGLEIARAGGVATILNPAPAADLPDAMLALCDFLTPNESEAAALTGLPVGSLAEAEAAARALCARGVGTALVTLGENGVLMHDGTEARHFPALSPAPVVETTGAGDAFNGGFAAALAEGRPTPEAVRFGIATAAISVTRPGAAASMPERAEIEALLARG